MKRANELLSDDDTRHIIDVAGVEALDLKLVTVEGARHRSDNEILDEIRLSCGEEALREAENAFNASTGGLLSINVDASQAVRRPTIVRFFAQNKFDMWDNQPFLAEFNHRPVRAPHQRLSVAGALLLLLVFP